MKITKYEESYRKEVRRICIATGSKDNLVNPEHYAFTLAMYCDPYLDDGLCYLLVDEEEKPHGYILCAPDYRKFVKTMIPYVEKIQKEAPSFLNRCDLSEYAMYQDDYPAHLHIDIEEEYTGHGNGPRLMQTLLEALRKRNVNGIMVGVAKDNPRACHFYQKCGFQVLEESQFGYTMGRKL